LIGRTIKHVDLEELGRLAYAVFFLKVELGFGSEVLVVRSNGPLNNGLYIGLNLTSEDYRADERKNQEASRGLVKAAILLLFHFYPGLATSRLTGPMRDSTAASVCLNDVARDSRKARRTMGRVVGKGKANHEGSMPSRRAQLLALRIWLQPYKNRRQDAINW
jgi:hypothetical protein